VGAFVGGYIVDGMSLIDTPWIGSLIVLGALALTHVSGVLDRRAPLQTTEA
jgi:predicted MFS family arabinose efflux permease